MPQEQAQGILVAALGVLAGHLGYGQREAGLLKQAELVPIVTVNAKSSGGWRIQPDAHPFDLYGRTYSALPRI